MIKLSNKSFALAFVVSLAAPLAFAQDATTEATTDATTQAPPTEQTPVVTEGSVDATQQLSWNEVDTDQDGALSQAEAVAVPALVEVFAEADTDADGALTPEEYQTFVAQVDSGNPPVQ